MINDSNKFKKRSQVKSIWNRLKKNKAAMFGLIVICIFVFFAIFADIIADYDELAIKQNSSTRLIPPSREHWFGTDAFGRDMFARIVHGARISLSFGLISTSISVIIGGAIGAVAAYYGGAIDNMIMRVMDIFMCIPAILLALVLVAALGTSLTNLLIAVVISSVPPYVRVVRSVMLPIAELDFIEAAKAYGAGDIKIILRHIIPNSVGPILVQATMGVAVAIMSIAALSFIGMGIQPPTPEWGSMLAESREFMRYAPYLVIIPGITIVLAALSLNLLGDGLRDALDPKLKN